MLFFSPRPNSRSRRFCQGPLFPRVRVISFGRRRFTLRLMNAWLSFDQRVIWHDDELLSYVEIGIGAHVAVKPGTLRIEEVLQLVADALADDEADNCPIRAID